MSDEKDDDNDDYEFFDPSLWKKDERMGAFGKELKNARWEDMPNSDMKVLKLEHLFIHDDMTPLKVNRLKGKTKPRNWVFLRPETKGIWDFMYEKLTTNSSSDSEGCAFFKVSGNSGIGKSYTMLYLLKKFLDAGEAVFYDDRKETRIYAFIPVKQPDGSCTAYNAFVATNEFLKGASQGLLKKMPSTKEVMPPVLWDPHEQDAHNFRPNYMGESRTLVAVSVKEQLVKNPEKDFEVDTRYIKQYSLDHLETLRQVAYPTFNPQELRYRFYRYGGLLRYAFANASKLAEIEAKVEESINGLTLESLGKILQNVVGDMYKVISSGVFQVQPDPRNPSRMVLDYGSPYAFARLAGRFWESMAQQGSGENRRHTSWFEAMVIHRLTEGGTFKVRRLENSSPQTTWTGLTLPKVPVKTIGSSGTSSVNENYYSAWAMLKGGHFMLSPESDTLPVVDCADQAFRGFRCTAAQDSHVIAYDECGKIMNAHDMVTGGVRGRLQLYFAVPEWNADWFRKQSFRGVGKGKTNVLSLRVDQYVLKIDCDHVKSLTDLYDERKDVLEQSFNDRVDNAERFRKRRRLQESQ